MKRSFSIRTYLGLSYALLLVISLGTIGFIWSRNEYEVITREFQLLMRDRATVISDIISHELEEHDQIKFEQAEFPIDNFSKTCILQGVDQLGYLQSHTSTVEAYESGHPDRVNTLAAA